MDQILLGLGAAGDALLIIAIAVAVWEHRRHRAEMRLQRIWSDNTRDLLRAHAEDVDARLATLAAAVHAQRATAPTPEQAASDAPRLRAAGSGAAPPAKVVSTAQAATSQHWIETEPMVLTSQVLTPETDWPRMPDFDPTMPAELSEH